VVLEREKLDWLASWDCALLVRELGVCVEGGKRGLYVLVVGFWRSGFAAMRRGAGGVCNYVGGW